MEIWLELEHVDEEERSSPKNWGLELCWNARRESYMTGEAMLIWHLNELCQRENGIADLEGCVFNGRYYLVGREVLRGMAIEMKSWAAARIEQQTALKYGLQEADKESNEDGEESEQVEEGGRLRR